MSQSVNVPIFSTIRALLIHGYITLRIDNCDERRVYKSEDISGPKGGFIHPLKAQIFVYLMIYGSS